MKSGYLLSIFVCALLLVMTPFVSAIVVERMEVTECGFTTNNPVACGQTARVTCRANTTFTGNPAPEIVVVKFKVGNEVIDGSLLSGTARDGYWYADVNPENYSVDGKMRLNHVYAYDSEGNAGPNGCDYAPTKANDLYQRSECIVRTGSIIEIATTCDCTYDEEAFCSPMNVWTRTVTPSDGCEDQTVQTTTGYCDYCRPDWVSVIGKCTYSKEYNVTDKFIGVATKTYVTGSAAGEECKQIAQDGAGDPADALPPPDDGALVLCRMDAWSAGGKDTANSNRHEGETSVRAAFGRDNFTMSIASGTDSVGRIIKPMVFDVDQDGDQDFIFFSSNIVTVKTAGGDTLTEVNLGNVELEGQPSLWGYAYSEAQMWLPAVRDGSQGAGVAGIYYNNTDNKDYFVSITFAVGTAAVSEIRRYQVDSVTGTTAYGSGVVCDAGYCWYVTNGMHAVLTDMTSPSLARVVYSASPGLIYETSMATTPVLINMGSSVDGPFPSSAHVVAWLGKTSTPKMAWFACTTVGVCAYHELESSDDLRNVTNVVVGSIAPPAASCIGTRTGACSQFTGDKWVCLNHGCNYVTEGGICDGDQSLCSEYGDKTSCESSYCTWTQTGTSSKAQMYLMQEKDVGGSRSAVVRAIELVGTGVNAASGLPSALTFSNPKSVSVSGIGGGVETCVSEPTAAKCASGGKGVAVMSMWSPSSATVVTNALWSMKQYVQSGGTNVQSPLNGFNPGLPSAIGSAICGTSRCYLISGSSTGGNTGQYSAQGDYSIYSNVNDGPYSQVSTYGVINTISVPYSSYNSTCIADNRAGDRIWGYGVYGDDLVVLVRYLNMQTTANCADIKEHMKLMRYSVTSGWSTVVDFGNKTANTGLMAIVPQSLERSGTMIYLKCGERGTPYCTWMTGDGSYRGRGFIVVNMDTNTIRKQFEMKGTYFGGNLNQTWVLDWAMNESDYVMLSVSQYNMASSAVVMYTDVSPSAPLVMDSALSSDAAFLGIVPKSGQWWWTSIPRPTNANTPSCAFLTTTDTVRNTQYIWNAPGMGDFEFPVSYVGQPCYGCNYQNLYGNNSYNYCYASIKRYPGSLGPSPEVYADAYWSLPYPASVQPYSSSNAYSAYGLTKSGFDAAGKYFLQYVAQISGGGTGAPSQHAAVVVYRDGGSLKTYFPHGVEVSNYGGQIGQSADATLCSDPSGTQRVYKYVGASAVWNKHGTVDNPSVDCFPVNPMTSTHTAYKTPLMGGTPSVESPRILREYDTSTGKFTVDYMTSLTSSSAATTTYNQLNCYAYSSSGTMVEDTPKQLGAAYCVKQIASAELNADGKDEIILPQGVYSVGGSSTSKIRLDGDIDVSSTAMEVVDINGDTFSDIFQVTAAGIEGVVTRPTTRGFNPTGMTLSDQAFCFVRNEEDLECERYGGSKAECTSVNLYFAPQLLGGRDPSALQWQAKVYKAGGGAVDAAVEVTFSFVVDSLLRFLGLAGAYDLAHLAGIPIIEFTTPDIGGHVDVATDVLVQDVVRTGEYGSYVVSEPGTYKVFIVASDETFGQRSPNVARCTVEDVTMPVIEEEEGEGGVVSGVCSLGTTNIDGEFNYPEDITQHQWVVNKDEDISYALGDGLLKVSGQNADAGMFASHGLLCVEKKMTMEVKFRIPTSSDSSATFFLYGASVDNPDQKLPVSFFTVHSKDGTTKIISYGSGDDPDEPQLVYSAPTDTSKWFVVQVIADRVGKTVTTSIVDTTYSAVNDFVNEVYGGFTSASFRAGGSKIDIDYIRTSAGGGSFEPKPVEQTEVEAAFAALNNCSTLIEKLDGRSYSPDDFGNLSSRAAHVSAYCELLPSTDETGGKCTDYSQLANAVRYNDKCYDEAYRYCVSVTYPGIETVSDSGQSVRLSGSGLDGATVCAAELTVTSGVEKIGKPLLKMSWRIFIDYWQYWLLIIGLIAVVSIARSRVR